MQLYSTLFLTFSYLYYNMVHLCDYWKSVSLSIVNTVFSSRVSWDDESTVLIINFFPVLQKNHPFMFFNPQIDSWVQIWLDIPFCIRIHFILTGLLSIRNFLSLVFSQISIILRVLINFFKTIYYLYNRVTISQLEKSHFFESHCRKMFFRKVYWESKVLVRRRAIWIWSGLRLIFLEIRIIYFR